MLVLILVACGVVLASALSSMSEAAMLSISEVDVEKLLEERKRDSASLSLKKLHANLMRVRLNHAFFPLIISK